MKCEICGAVAQEFKVIRKPHENGRANTLACVPCAKASGYYCVRHEFLHLHLGDGAHACLACVEERAFQFSSATKAGLLFTSCIAPFYMQYFGILGSTLRRSYGK